jgi:predicted cobalt transporter CbtA
MARALLIRGLLVGLLAGILMFGFGKLAGEPSVDRASAFESAHKHAEHTHDHLAAAEAPEPELFSRDTQSGIGLLTGVGVYGVAFGGLFSLVFAYAYGRVGTAGPKPLAALLAAAGFLAISVVPMIIYPSNPPAIGEPDTIAPRTALYFIMIAISVAATIGALMIQMKLARRTDGWTAGLAALGTYVLIIGLAAALLPAIDEVPAAFPARVLWHFRIASMGLQLVMWATFGTVFGLAAERLLAPQRRGLGRLQPLVR